MSEEVNISFSLNERAALLLAMNKTLNQVDLDIESAMVSGVQPGDIVDLFLDANMKNIQNTLRKNYKEALEHEVFSSGAVDLAEHNGLTKDSLFK